MIIPEDLQKFHNAARIIERDGVEGYYTCRKKFGADIANALVVAHCRHAAIIEKENTGLYGWPDEDITRRVMELLSQIND